MGKTISPLWFYSLSQILRSGDRPLTPRRPAQWFDLFKEIDTFNRNQTATASASSFSFARAGDPLESIR